MLGKNYGQYFGILTIILRIIDQLCVISHPGSYLSFYTSYLRFLRISMEDNDKLFRGVKLEIVPIRLQS
jgi:hypothetical protein